MAKFKPYKRSALAALALIAAGCSSLRTEPTVGIVTSNQSVAVSVGSQAPDVTFLDRSGTRRALSAIYQDATVVAFTSGPCTEPNTRLVAASDGLRNNVALVQISSCGGECCKSHDQCLQTMADKAKHMIAICDPHQRLRREYGVRAGAAVFVLDGHGRVVSKSSLQNLAASVRRASQLAANAEQEREILYGG